MVGEVEWIIYPPAVAGGFLYSCKQLLFSSEVELSRFYEQVFTISTAANAKKLIPTVLRLDLRTRINVFWYVLMCTFIAVFDALFA